MRVWSNLRICEFRRVTFDETVPPVADVPGDGTLPYHTEELALRTFGRSLFAAHCPRYSSDFVLMGVTEGGFIPDVVADLRTAVVVCVAARTAPCPMGGADLTELMFGDSALQLNVLNENVARAACVVINADDW